MSEPADEPDPLFAKVGEVPFYRLPFEKGKAAINLHTHVGDGEIGGVSFDVSSWVTGTIEIGFGDDSVTTGRRYVVLVPDLIRAAYLHDQERAKEKK